MGAPTLSEIIVVWDLHVLGSIELLLHLSDLLLIDLNFSWSKDWGLDKGKSWLTKNGKLENWLIYLLCEFSE